MNKLKFYTKYKNKECDLYSFFERNIPLLTALGIFGALSILAFSDTDQSLRSITTLSYLLVLFLLLIIAFNATKLILNDFKNNINQKLTLLRIWNYFSILFVMITLLLFIIALYDYLISQFYPLFWTFLGLISIIIGSLLAIFIGFTLIKSYSNIQIFLIFILSTGINFLLSKYYLPIFNSNFPENLSLYPILGILCFGYLLWLILFCYLIYILYKKEL